jgi:predicted dehydrogenase
MGLSATVRYFPENKENDPRAYLDAIRDMPKPGCAIIATPDDLHREMAEATIKAGLHTLVVKPLAPTLQEVRELVELQRQFGVYCAVDFHKRYDYANLKLRDVIASGAIGDPLYCIVMYSQKKSVPAQQFRKWVERTTIFQYLGIHYIDIMYFATRAKPLRAMALGQKNWLYAQGLDTYDSVQGVIEWQMPSGGRFAQHILTNWIDPESSSAMSEQNIKIIGTKGRVESDQKDRGFLTVTDGRGIEHINPYFTSPYQIGGRTVYRGYGIDSIRTFLDDAWQVQQGQIQPTDLEGQRATFRESLVPTAVLEAVGKSLKSDGAWVAVPDVT